MKKIFSIVLAVVCLCLFRPVAAPGETAPSNEEPKGTIVARVNGVGITLRSLIYTMEQFGKQQGANAEKPPENGAVRKKALDRLILEELAVQKAWAEGLKADPADVDRQIQELKTKLGDEAFRQTLDKEQVTEKELRTAIERRIALQLINQKEIVDVAGNVPLSEEAINREYEKTKERLTVHEKMEVIDVVLFLEPEDPQSAKKAEEVLKAIMADKDRDPHSLVPDNNYIVYDIEVKKMQQPEIYQEARKLEVGGISGVIKTGDSLHIIKLKSYTPEKQFPLDEVRKYLEMNLREEALRNRLHQWEAEIRKDARIEIMGPENH
jgi:parvulin-like peptidyl-prolyl isomerase